MSTMPTQAGGVRHPQSRRAERFAAAYDRQRMLHHTFGSNKATHAVLAIVLTIIAVLFLVPLGWGILTSLKHESDAGNGVFNILPTEGFTFDAYIDIFTKGNVTLWLWNSVWMSAVVTVLTVAVTVMVAYAFSRLEFAGRKLLFMLTIASIMVPGQVLIVPLYRELLALNLIDTAAAAILPQLIAPVLVFVMKRFFDAVPHELEEAARIDGASRVRILWSVYLPLARSGLVAITIFTFIGAWNNFLLPFLVLNNPNLMPLPVGLATVKDAFGVLYAQPMAMAIVAGLPLVIVFMIFQRQIISGFATTGIGGQ
ncbi:carbohydrate ABC transporter permease [Micrococcales bacterium 31B]|nr:carbohydrate ABC transporter permease [Micrococcales bacterium 31B]